MKDKKYLYPGLVAIFCALMVSLGLVSLIYGSPGTTTIGENISTTDLTVSGNATTTGNFVVNGNTILGNAAADTLTVNANTTFATTTIFNGAVTINSAKVGTNFVIDSSGNASTTGNLIVGGTTNLGNTTIGSGTAITKHETKLISVDFNLDTENACTLATTTISGAVATSTVTVGMPHTPANLVGTTGSYWGAWVSGVTSADEVSFRYCTGSGVGATTTDATLDVRLDLWKH